MPAQVAERTRAQRGSLLQARCDQVLVTNDWCLPLVLALLLLLLIYTFLYLPSLAHHNTTLWNLAEKHNCGYKHLTLQTATPTTDRIIWTGLWTLLLIGQTATELLSPGFRKRKRAGRIKRIHFIYYKWANSFNLIMCFNVGVLSLVWCGIFSVLSLLCFQ